MDPNTVDALIIMGMYVLVAVVMCIIEHQQEKRAKARRAANAVVPPSTAPDANLGDAIVAKVVADFRRKHP